MTNLEVDYQALVDFSLNFAMVSGTDMTEWDIPDAAFDLVNNDQYFTEWSLEQLEPFIKDWQARKRAFRQERARLQAQVNLENKVESEGGLATTHFLDEVFSDL